MKTQLKQQGEAIASLEETKSSLTSKLEQMKQNKHKTEEKLLNCKQDKQKLEFEFDTLKREFQKQFSESVKTFLNSLSKQKPMISAEDTDSV